MKQLTEVFYHLHCNYGLPYSLILLLAVPETLLRVYWMDFFFAEPENLKVA